MDYTILASKLNQTGHSNEPIGALVLQDRDVVCS